ncbi:hypothetical protein LCGC14_3029140, partial [marine sediment metagenome]
SAPFAYSSLDSFHAVKEYGTDMKAIKNVIKTPMSTNSGWAVISREQPAR